MPVQFINGDIFTSTADAIVNPVNTMGISGKGLAKEFKQRFPDAHHRYKTCCTLGQCETGMVIIYDRGILLPPDKFVPRFIVFFPTKQHWRNPSKLEWIEQGLDDLVEGLKWHPIKSIALPKLGCGYGGLDWDDVKPLMEDFARQVPTVDVQVYV